MHVRIRTHTLNNLLENREMALDDGRFLMSASRYQGMYVHIYTCIRAYMQACIYIYIYIYICIYIYIYIYLYMHIICL